MAKNKGGRPAKITKERLGAIEKILDDDMNVVALTDDDLRTMANDMLPEKYHIHTVTFQEYKAGKTLKDPKKQKLLDEFSLLYKKALLKQKKNLLLRLGTESNQRQRRAWIIERKFDEWNLRKISDTTLKGDKENPLFDTVKINIVK